MLRLLKKFIRFFRSTDLTVEEIISPITKIVVALDTHHNEQIVKSKRAMQEAADLQLKADLQMAEAINAEKMAANVKTLIGA